MPKCRENRKLRLKRAKAHEKRISQERPKKWNGNHVADFVRDCCHDLGRPDFTDVDKSVQASPIMDYFFRKENVVLGHGVWAGQTDQGKITSLSPWITSGVSWNLRLPRRPRRVRPAKFVDTIRARRLWAMIRLLDMMEATFREKHPNRDPQEFNFWILRGEWLVECYVKCNGKMCVWLDATYAFVRKEPKSDQKTSGAAPAAPDDIPPSGTLPVVPATINAEEENPLYSLDWGQPVAPDKLTQGES